MSGVMIMVKLRKLFFLLIRFSLLPHFFRRFYQSKGIVIFLFHEVDDSFIKTYQAISSLYNITSLDRAIDFIKTGDTSSLLPCSAVITFDDARRSNLKLLQHKGLFKYKPYVFVSTADQRLDGEKFVSPNEVPLLGEIFEYGSHTHSHPKLPFLSTGEQYHEIHHGKKELETMLAQELGVFAYPYGLYSSETVNQVINSGFTSALTVDSGVNRFGDDLYRLKRICLDTDMSYSELIVKSSGLWDVLFNRKSLNREVFHAGNTGD